MSNNDSPIAVEFSQLTKKDKKTKLKHELNNTFTIGQNYLTVTQITEKFVQINEMFNGLAQDHTRYNINNALMYLDYRKKQFTDWPKEFDIIDLSKQTPQYRSQYHTVQELKHELENHIYLVLHPKNPPLPEIKSTIEIEPKLIKMHIESGHIIEIHLADFNPLEKFFHRNLSIQHDYHSPLIGSEIDWYMINILAEVSRLCYDMSKESKDFFDVFTRYSKCSIQLNKLYTNPVKSTDKTLLEDLYNFIRSAPVGDTYLYQLQSFNGYERYATLTKTTRVRSMFEIHASKDDIHLWEFRKQYYKISHEIDDNIQDISSIVEAHNF